LTRINEILLVLLENTKQKPLLRATFVGDYYEKV